MRFACCHLVTLGACVLLRKVSVGMSFEWKTSDACGKTCNAVLFLTRFVSWKQRKPVDIYIISTDSWTSSFLLLENFSSLDFPLENRANRSISKGSVQIREHQPLPSWKNTYPVRSSDFWFLSPGVNFFMTVVTLTGELAEPTAKKQEYSRRQCASRIVPLLRWEHVFW